jgi:WD40 repeat protein
VPKNSVILKSAFTTDGTRLVLTTTSGDLIVLNVAKMAHVHHAQDAVRWTVTANSGSTQGLAISDSGFIATASSAGNVRVWSPDGHQLADIPIHPDDVPALAFAPKTNTLYYEDGNDVVRKFSLDNNAAVRLAQSLVTREFTEEECARYFPGQRCPRFQL